MIARSALVARSLPSCALALGLAALCACSAGEASPDGAPVFDGPPATQNTPPATGQQPNTPASPNTPSTPSSNPTPGSTQTPSDQNPSDSVPLVPGESGNQGDSQLGSATMGGTGSSSERYFKTDVTRDGQNYFFMANGWGPGFDKHTISYSGTSFTVQSLTGTQGPMYEPAAYPTVFCGAYSDARSRECGLPAALDSLSSLRTGWSWNANGNDGEYNAAYDIWLGTSDERSSFSGYLMVWYREPVGQQPAGSPMTSNVTVANVPGNWNIWTGQVGGKPIINYVRAEHQDTPSMEFDILDFVDDVKTRGMTLPGSHVLSVAVGFEIWKGPITNLQSLDFYVDPQ
jgi:glycosyl hydrolase family 12